MVNTVKLKLPATLSPLQLKLWKEGSTGKFSSDKLLRIFNGRRLGRANTKSYYNTGIMSLPVELLIYVFNIVALDSEESAGRRKMNKLIRTLSLVSKTFRDAVLNTTSFWTKIDNNYCLKEENEEFGVGDRIVRSKNAPLWIQLNLRPLPLYLRDRALLRIRPLRDRWRRIELKLPWDEDLVAKPFPHLQFPIVEVVSLACISAEELATFFSKWTFPGMTTLVLIHAIPRSGVFSNLTFFFFVTYEPLDDSPDSNTLRELLGILSSMQKLQKLRLRLMEIADSQSHDLPIVDLPCLTTLDIDYHSKDPVQFNNLRRLLGSLRIPKLEACILSLYIRRATRKRDWASSLFVDTIASPKLIHFFMLSDARIGESGARGIFTAFPNIQLLYVDAPGFAKGFKAFYAKQRPVCLESATVNRKDIMLGEEVKGSNIVDSKDAVL